MLVGTLSPEALSQTSPHGYATPMRGKSTTCLKMPIQMTVCDRDGSETLRERGFAAGKSETCRSSEWHSHWIG